MLFGLKLDRLTPISPLLPPVVDSVCGADNISNLFSAKLQSLLNCRCTTTHDELLSSSALTMKFHSSTFLRNVSSLLYPVLSLVNVIVAHSLLIISSMPLQ